MCCIKFPLWESRQMQYSFNITKESFHNKIIKNKLFSQVRKIVTIVIITKTCQTTVTVKFTTALSKTYLILASTVFVNTNPSGSHNFHFQAQSGSQNFLLLCIVSINCYPVEISITFPDHLSFLALKGPACKI